MIDRPSDDPQDLYIQTLVRDLTHEASTEFSKLPRPAIISQPGPSLCGPSTVDIYAGRHDQPLSGSSQPDTFTTFLEYISAHCDLRQPPFIIADDGVSRFIADPAQRDNPEISNKLYISHATKGIGILATGGDCLNANTASHRDGQLGQLCPQYATIVSRLRSQSETRGLPLLWTGERVGLAYDAAELFLDVVEERGPIAAANIPDVHQRIPFQRSDRHDRFCVSNRGTRGRSCCGVGLGMAELPSAACVGEAWAGFAGLRIAGVTGRDRDRWRDDGGRVLGVSRAGRGPGGLRPGRCRHCGRIPAGSQSAG